MSKRYDGIIEELNFKKKTYGYHSSTMSLTFDNGKVYSQSRLTDPMMKIFNAYIANRPSCGECVTKVEKGYSDFTIFDCWHFSELTGKPDNDLGYTNVLIRTEKAHNLLKKCSNLMDITEIKVNEVLSFDRGSSLFESMTPNKDRENFFIEFQNYGLMSAIKTFIPITYVSHIKEWIKKSLYKLGMLRKVKKIVRR
jgi:hypothetical protein